MYADRIRSIVPTANPAHVEAWMRDKFGTLDHLSAAQFRAEAIEGAMLADESPKLSEQLAASFGIAA